jgi:hypothetical protein
VEKIVRRDRAAREPLGEPHGEDIGCAAFEFNSLGNDVSPDSNPLDAHIAEIAAVRRVDQRRRPQRRRMSGDDEAFGSHPAPWSALRRRGRSGRRSRFGRSERITLSAANGSRSIDNSSLTATLDSLYRLFPREIDEGMTPLRPFGAPGRRERRRRRRPAGVLMGESAGAASGRRLQL